MDAREYRSLGISALKGALARLDRAVQELTAVCPQPAPASKVPRFELPGGFVWPCRGETRVHWGEIRLEDPYCYTRTEFPLPDAHLPGHLFTACALEPELLAEALRTLEAAEAWCRDRLEYPGRVLAENPELRAFIEARAVMGALES